MWIAGVRSTTTVVLEVAEALTLSGPSATNAAHGGARPDGPYSRGHPGAHLHAAPARVVRGSDLGAVAAVADPGGAVVVDLVGYG